MLPQKPPEAKTFTRERPGGALPLFLCPDGPAKAGGWVGKERENVV